MRKDLTGPVVEAQTLEFSGPPQGFQDRIEKLARRIEGLPHVNSAEVAGETFTMAAFYKVGCEVATCDTVCCIAGWAHVMYASSVRIWLEASPINIGADALGIDTHTANKLFIPSIYAPITLANITPRQAAAALRRVARGARTIQEIWGDIA